MHVLEPDFDESQLEVLAELADEVRAPQIAREARTFADRVTAGLFYVACVGQFKRGKSTLLNAILEDRVLPVGVVPVTAVVTVVRYGPHRHARVRLGRDEWRTIEVERLADFVAEECNPGNSKGVTAAEVYLPNPLLEHGMCLVDTPGISSIFVGNTAATKAFVPHVDAALVVLGADPPISADELGLIKEIASQTDTLLLVLNKADRLEVEEERRQARKFTAEILGKELPGKAARFFEVSASERLAGTGPERDWPVLRGALETLAEESGSSLVQETERRALALLGGRLRHHVLESRDALVRPIEATERRVEMLRGCVAEAQQSLRDLSYLFDSEQDRMGQVFERNKAAFVERAVPQARQELTRILASSPLRASKLRMEAIHQAEEISHQGLDEWLATAQPEAERLYIQASNRFVELANGFLKKLAESGDPALATLPSSVTPETGFRTRSRLYYSSLSPLVLRTPFGGFLDLIRSRKQQARALEEEIGKYLETLVTANANRIVNDFNDRVQESRWRFQNEVVSYLNELSSTAESALDRARHRRAEDEASVKAEVENLEGILESLSQLGRSDSR
jgi:GTP-binding protein EngB required for normal cell division